ncbi:MAG: DegT/DnrJ/EryC1/StrS family aminotransferase [Oscillospiraceae bacterium]|nr:DegT/DnrJ/EryC1/StrS family aminotransferase [Oscillospiraceae bacterium]
MGKLAIKGGVPVRSGKSFPGWPQSGQNEREKLIGIYESGNLGGGTEVEAFAERFALYSDTKYCIPMANGTVTLEMTMRALEIGRGDEVILPPYTFIATLSSIIFAGATPVFADIDRETYNISPESIAAKITPKTKAVIAVCVGGRPIDVDAIQKVTDEKGVYLIIDAAQGVGSAWSGKSLGKYGIAASISCQNSKNLTAGEGGIIITDSDLIYNKTTEMLNDSCCYNNIYQDNNMTAFQAGIMNVQMDRLDEQITKRMDNAAYLDKRLNETGIVSSLKIDGRITRNSYHLYLCRFNYEKLAELDVDRNKFIAALNAEGVGISNGYMPLYTFPCVSSDYTEKILGSKVDVSPLPECEIASYKEGAWMYQSVMLGEISDMDDIADAVIKIYENIEELRD